MVLIDNLEVVIAHIDVIKLQDISQDGSFIATMMENIEDRLFRYRAKRLRFLINGDKFFTGINYALNTEKIRSYDALLNDLTMLLMDNIKLCKGVRYIFTSEGGPISALADFQDGNTYICSSIDTFITTEYQISNGMLNWLVRNSACISSGNVIKSKRLTPTTKSASHRNSNINNHSQHLSNQIKSISKRTPKRIVNNSQIHNHSQESDAHLIKVSTPNNIDNIRKRIGNSSPQLQKHSQNRTNFGFEVIEKYDIGRPIGDGHFSVVYCCMNKATQEFCALKLIDKLKCRGRDDMIYNEVKILKQLKHPNIVKLIEEFDYSKQLYLILELVQDGDLFDAISTVTKFNEVHVSTMIYNLSSALAYLHRQGIVHRDIKPENLLISVQEDGSQSVKLADFGLAVEVSDNALYSVCGTAFYVSPEMLNETGYDFKVDVWSAGVICFILLCGYPPFTSENESNQDELFDAIIAGDFQFAPPYWSKISQQAKNLVKCMLTVEPTRRYTAEQVFNDPWTSGTSSNFDGVNPMNMSRVIASQF